ncbi:hypothetical protein AGMMS50262_08840 [Bacteroidia bacterium]|nr:hypothetical protein AGMMS50262_08840 [Bacteroidia bacterium]
MNYNFFKGAMQFAFDIWTKDVTSENYKEEIKKAQSYCWLFFISVLVSATVYVVFEKPENDFHLISNLILVWLFLSFLPLIFGFILLLSKIEKIHLSTKSECNSIHKCKAAIKESIIDKDFIHIKQFTKEQLQKYEDYKNFIVAFEESTQIKPEVFGTINKDGLNSIGGRFQCVIANPDYYKGDVKKVNGLIQYFLGNYQIASNNQYVRIFSLPMRESRNILTEQENEVLFFYVLSNVCAGIDTYVLEVELDKPYEFFKTIDYVIGDVFDSKTGLKKSKLYFSYAIDDKNRNNILCTTDDCLLHLMQSDFNVRQEICNNSNTDDRCMKITNKKDKEYNDLVKILGFSKEKESQVLTTFKNRLDEKNEDGINYRNIGNTIANEAIKIINSLISK